uniref:hypothetical protein n=1 Tax=Mesorhizobium sp. M0895 TaxID=2957019 RepID=UPI003338AEE7
MRQELQAALGHLLEVLEADGVVLQCPARNSTIEQELTRFDACAFRKNRTVVPLNRGQQFH